MSSTPSRVAPAERAATWRLASLVARLDSHPHRAEELRRAIGPDGVREPERLALTLFGIVSLARRAGCAPGQVRDLVHCFVQGALAGSHDPRFVERLVLHCGRFAEAACAPFDGRASPPASALASLAPLALLA